MSADWTAQPKAAATDPRYVVEFSERKLDAVFADINQCQLPGAVVGVAVGGRPAYRKGFGVASMELPVLLSSTIRMRIGSTTKHFAALAYLLLCEEGKAEVNAPVGQYLPELHPVTHRVTMRQLMAHLSGLRDVHDICFQFSGEGRAVSSADLLALYRDIDDVNAPPGTIWDYNNGAYLILSAAIERIAGKNLEDVLRERIFDPVGMYSTLLRRRDNCFVPDSATLHMTNGKGEYEKGFLGTAFAGEGGMVSTVNDMLRWLAHMDRPSVGSARTWALLKEAQKLPDGTSTGYGMGLITGSYRGVETLFHPGGGMGGNAQMLKVPGAHLDIVVMVNRHDLSAAALANKVLDACLPGLDPVPPPCKGGIVTGSFRSTQTGRVIQLAAREGEQIASIDGFDWPFVRQEERVMGTLPIWSFIKQSISLEGDPDQPTSIRLTDFGQVDELVPIMPAAQEDLSAIEGRYRSATTGTQMTIAVTSQGPELTTIGKFGSAVFQLECLAKGLWRAKSASPLQWWGGILAFAAGGESLSFTSLRTRGLLFQRVR
jgi:D-aminopeptidase